MSFSSLELFLFGCLEILWVLAVILYFPLTCYDVSALQELQEVRRKNAALQMQQFVGEEKNDLLDYLRSLQPEKVCVKPAEAMLQLVWSVLSDHLNFFFLNR